MPDRLSEFCRTLVHAPWFHRGVMAAILLAGALAGVETDPAMIYAHGPLLGLLDRVVIGVFVVEAALKIAAQGRTPWRYFQDGWNVFDFIVLVLCLLPMNSAFAMVLRLGRALRLLRLVSALPKLQLLVGALIKSFSSMGYVGLLLGLMFYIYAITGVHLFGAHAKEHFGSLSAAFLTLFQTITLDDWRNLYASASAASPVAAAFYFISFILLGTMIMLNLFIGIIMNSMSEMHDELAENSPPPTRNPAELDRELADLARRIQQLRQSLTTSSNTTPCTNPTSQPPIRSHPDSASLEAAS
jgi:voltage-gated sodium channel